jgi:hypothetical protein
MDVARPGQGCDPFGRPNDEAVMIPYAAAVVEEYVMNGVMLGRQIEPLLSVEACAISGCRDDLGD